MIQLETDRLLLRPFAPEDAPGLFELNNDPEVLKYTGDKPFASVQEAAAFIEQYDQYHRYGYGRLAMLLKESGAFAGWCGLKYHPDTGETDIGYRLKRVFWNQGLATEAARRCLQFGLEQLGLPVIIAHAIKANTASIKVMEKIGMQYWKDFLFDGEPGVFYRSYLLNANFNL